MANKWWRIGAASNWQWANGWDIAEGGPGGDGEPTATEPAYFSQTSSTYKCTVNTSGELCHSLATKSTITGGSDNGDSEIDLGTYDLDIKNDMDIDGVDGSNKMIITIGVSASNGLIVRGNATWHSTNTILNLQLASIIQSYGNWMADGFAYFGTDKRGRFFKLGNGNYCQTQGQNRWDYFKIDTGVTLSVPAGKNCYFQDGEGSGFDLLGTLTVPATGSAEIGGGAWVIGVASDITGAGDIKFQADDATTFTINKAGAFSFTGNIEVQTTSWYDRTIFIGDFSNAGSYYITDEWNGPGAAGVMNNAAGTLKTNGFQIKQPNSKNITINNATNNPSFEFGGSIDVKVDAGGTLTWTKGTGTIKGVASSGTATWAWHGLTIEAVEIDCDGAITQLTENVTTENFTLTNGIFQDNGKTLTSLGSVEIADLANKYVSTGVLGLTGTGNLANPHSTNIFKSILIAGSSITLTTIDDVYTKQIGIGDSTTLTGTDILYIVNPTVNNFMQPNNTGSLDCPTNITLDAGRENVGFTLDDNLTLANSSSNALTITTALDINNLTLDTGSALIIQNTLNTDAFVINGTFNDGGQAVTINGNLTIANVASRITSTGIWTANDDINISNPHSTNILNQLNIAATKTLSRATAIYAKKVVLGNNAGLDGAFVLSIINPSGNDFLTLGTNATITQGNIEITLDANRSNIGFTTVVDFTMKSSASKKLTITSNLTVNDIEIEANAHIETEAGLNGIDTNVDGELTLDPTETNIVTDISGSGTLHSATASTATLYYRGNNTFAGVLDKVILEEYPPARATQAAYYGANMDKAFHIMI